MSNAAPTPPPVALDRQAGARIPRKQVFSWALWDWATQPFNTVITTFVFAVYLTSDTFFPPGLEEGTAEYTAVETSLSAGLGAGVTAAGILVALVAPVLGRRTDGTGTRKLWLGVNTMLLVLTMASMFFVVGDPSFFVLGVALLAVGNIFSEIAAVNYNALLTQVSTPANVGRVSGLGWGLGYIGGILLLLLLYVLFLSSSPVLPLPSEDGLSIRIVVVICAVWTLLFSIPILLFVPEPPKTRTERIGFFRSYGVLVRDIRALFRDFRPTFWFLIASAVYRDGLAGVFAFGAIIAGGTFGFEFSEVLIFGIAANLIAGLSTLAAGLLDDRLGARWVIQFSLIGLVVVGLGVFLLHDGGAIVFWVGGLLLCCFVGPAQSASRSFLARVTPAGKEGEIFGLYATTGRAASFLAPALWTGFILFFGAQYWGILGIVLVIATGLGLLLLVRTPSTATPRSGAVS